MKIYPCIAGDGQTDSTHLRVGYQMEVGQIPRVGEKIRLKMNLFDHIFKCVHSDYAKGILFINGSTEGVVVDVVHSFRTLERPLTKLFPGNRKPELASAIHADSDFDLEQIVYVVIKFEK